MARGASASSHRDGRDNAKPNESKGTKRRCVQSACVPCRKRKSKCDAGTPVCATCIAVYKTDCFYDAESEHRRSKAGSALITTAGSKRDASTVASSSGETASSADFIVDTIRRLPEEHVQDFIEHLRKDPRLDTLTLADSWYAIAALPQSPILKPSSLETDLDVFLGKPAVTLTGQSPRYGYATNFTHAPENENHGNVRMRTHLTLNERRGTTWTTVTDDFAFIEKLFTLYFTWSHTFYVILSRECFYKDFKLGRDKYCSSVLVNAICAYACHLTDDPKARTDPTNFRTAGDHFFNEAKQLLFENETSNLATAQALCIMSMREASTGRDSSGFSYIGRCIRMCVELGLHLKECANLAVGLTDSEKEVRKITFWGCFTVDTVWSLYTGRIVQLPRAAITLEKPIFEEPNGYPEAIYGSTMVPPIVVTARMFLQQFTTLSELVNDTNTMVFTSKDGITRLKLLDCYNKYQDWYRRLLPDLGVEGKAQPEPHILVLHMLYFTLIVHLFRPYLNVDTIHASVSPRDICIEAANDVSRLVRIYRQHYDFRAVHLVIPHVLFTASVVHLLYSEDNSTSYRNLVESLIGLEDMHQYHYFAAKAFRVLHALSKSWNLPWPEELKTSILLPQHPLRKPRDIGTLPTESLLPLSSHSSAINPRASSSLTYPPVENSHRRESISIFHHQGSFQLASHPAVSRPGSAPTVHPHSHPHHAPSILTHNPSQQTPQPPPEFPSTLPISAYHYAHPISTISRAASPTITSPSLDTTDPLYWSPPSIPTIAPLLNHPSIPGLPSNVPNVPRAHFQPLSPVAVGMDTVLRSSSIDSRLERPEYKMGGEWGHAAAPGPPPQEQQGNEFQGAGQEEFGAQNASAMGGFMHRGAQEFGGQGEGVGQGTGQGGHDGHGHVGHGGHGREEYDWNGWQNETAE